MNPVAIRGIGPVGSFGCGRKALAESLRDGPPKPAEWLIPISGKETILAAHMADTAPLEGFLSRRETRRIDHFSKMALLGAFLALEDGDSFDSPGENMGLILATGYGATRTTFALSRADSSGSGSGSLHAPFRQPPRRPGLRSGRRLDGPAAGRFSRCPWSAETTRCVALAESIDRKPDKKYKMHRGRRVEPHQLKRGMICGKEPV